MFQNYVRDFNRLQGTRHPSDTHVQILRDINHRYITIENSGECDAGIAIRTFHSTPFLESCKGVSQDGDVVCNSEITYDFILKGGDVKHLSINTHGDTTQFLHIIDPKTKKYLARPTCIRRDSNQFVIRQGLNMWWVQFFKRAGYCAK